tara:strand:+ start:249 stop:1397 length:1149 start_codon:yes stop_codon:yes gene_type:complete
MKKSKKISNPKDKFFYLVKRTNEGLKDEFKLSDKEALSIWNRDISPYGYPSYQKSLLTKALRVLDFNTCQRNKMFDELVPSVKQDNGTIVKFSDHIMGLKTEFEVSNFYITDDLAHSLFNTDTPTDSNFIKNALNLNVLPKINIIFSNDFKLNSKDNWFFEALHSIEFRQVKDQGVDVSVYINKGTGSVSQSFRIPLTKNDCCQLCETQKFYDENHRGAYNYAVNMSLFLNPENRSDQDTNEYIKERGEGTSNLVNTFRKKALPDMYTFAVNLFCLMTQQPDIISVKKSASKYVATTNKGFASQKMNNVPNVHWLGADFTTRFQYSKKINTDLSDVNRGKPKRSHWRRGHWHTISQGPGRVQKKLRWFQPVFIKGHKQEENS